MAQRVHWTELWVGLTAAIVIAVAAVSILLFARVGALHGDTATLYVTIDDATGVLPGTEVWLVGQKVGLVKAVRFRPVAVDTTQRVLIETDILADRMPLIRRNSRPEVRPGGNLIGSPVVYLRAGTSDSPPVRSGDTLASHSSSRMAAVGVQMDTLGSRLNALSTASQHLIAQLKSPSTTSGALLTRGVGQIASARDIVSSITDSATSGSGSLGLAYRGNLAERIKRVFAEKDSITLLLSSGRGNVGRFRRDSTLPRQIAEIRAGVDSLRALFSNPQSGVARLRSDTTLKSEIARARVELDSLMRDIKKHPRSYISF